MQANQTSIGEFFRTRREQLKLTQWNVARSLGWKSPQFISNIERDEAFLPAEKVRPLAKILKIKPEKVVDMQLSAYRKAYLAKVNQFTETTKKRTKRPAVKKKAAKRTTKKK